MAEVLERSPAPYDPTVLPLTSLTPREQEVVLLRLSSLKYREIGARLNISAKTVSVLLTRAVRKLRQAVPGASSASEWKQVEDVEDRPETLQ